MQIRIFWNKSNVNQENSIYNFPSVRLFLHHSLLQIGRPSLYLEYHPILENNKLDLQWLDRPEKQLDHQVLIWYAVPLLVGQLDHTSCSASSVCIPPTHVNIDNQWQSQHPNNGCPESPKNCSLIRVFKFMWCTLFYICELGVLEVLAKNNGCRFVAMLIIQWARKGGERSNDGSIRGTSIIHWARTFTSSERI